MKMLLTWFSRPLLAALLFALLLPLQLAAQGVVSTGINGRVTDKNGQSVGGARVVVEHKPTGTRSTATTRADGFYTLSGLQAGGPYEVTVTTTDGRNGRAEGFFTQIGQSADVDVTLAAAGEQTVVLDKFVVSSNQSALNANAAGAGSMQTEDELQRLGSVTKSFADMIRTNPYVTLAYSSGNRPQLTALGQTARSNSISLDGAKINDQYGINGSLNALNNPISFDTIGQINIAVSPYEVRHSGFTGASVNAVTKSGTNEFKGSLYTYYTNDDLQGTDVFGVTKNQRSYLKQTTHGMTLGGPILKNRLFFFVNYEKFTVDSAPSQPGFVPDTSALSAITTKLDALTLQGNYKPDFGTFASTVPNRTQDEKFLYKLDWNIAPGHRLAARYSTTKSTVPGNVNYSVGAAVQGLPPTNLTASRGTALSRSGYVTSNDEKVMAVQSFNDWSDRLKTEMQASYYTYNQYSSPSNAFPDVRIYGVPGVGSNGPITNGVVYVGADAARQGSGVSADVFSYSGLANYYLDKLTFTAGFDREENQFGNLFRLNSYGVLEFANVASFQADSVSAFNRAIVVDGTPIWESSKMSVTGIFGQVKYDVNSRLWVMLGLRKDIFDTPTRTIFNQNFFNVFGRRNDGTIDGTSAVSPRVSFNYSFGEDRRVQLRGGVGRFQGRAPWVFINNTIANSGIGRFNITTNPGSLQGYLNTAFNPANPIGTAATDIGGRRNVDLMENGLKLPSVVRGNLAVDISLPRLSSSVTVEVIGTRNYDALFWQNLNIKSLVVTPTSGPAVGADGRNRFNGSSGGAGAFSTAFGNVIAMRNSDVGHSVYASVIWDRPMKNKWAFNASYTNGKSDEAHSAGQATGLNSWQRNAVFNQNIVEEHTSDNEVRHRVRVTFARELDFLKDQKTVLGLTYEGRSGMPYSWVYSNDLNGDGVAGNDIIYVPTGLSDPVMDFSQLTAAQAQAYDDFITANGLGAYRGRTVKANSLRQPWINRLDLHVSHTVPLRGRVELEVFADWVNFGAVISKDLFGYYEKLGDFNGIFARRFIGNATYNSTGKIRPTLATAADFPVPDNALSRWQLQFGARIRF